MLGQQTRETSLPAGGRRGWLYHYDMSINSDAICRPGKTKQTLDRKSYIILTCVTTAVFTTLLLFAFYIGVFAPIVTERKCTLFQKIHLGIMLRCSCLFGHIKEWRIDTDSSAEAYVENNSSSNQTWNVFLDGVYFESSRE